MTRTQKIWFWIGVGLLALPELLWSPVANFVYGFLNDSLYGLGALRANFLSNSDNINIFSFILGLQMLGVFLATTFYVCNRNLKYRVAFGILGYLLFLLIFFCFGLSVSFRHLGF